MRATLKLAALAATLGVAAALAACNGSDQPVATSSNTAPVSEKFSTFVQAVYDLPATATPVNFDSISLVYDVDDDPTAFAGYLM